MILELAVEMEVLMVESSETGMVSHEAVAYMKEFGGDTQDWSNFFISPMNIYEPDGTFVGNLPTEEPSLSR